MTEKLENGVGFGVSTCPCLVSSDKDTFLKLPIEKDGENMELSSVSDEMENGDLASGCQTPTESIFDPFAPGREDLVCAPKKKTMKESRIPLRRQLNFESCVDNVVEDDDDAEEDRFMESLRKSFLDLIISNQLRELSAKNSFVESSPSNGLKTPTSIPLLTGIAGTCPAAPMRPSSKSRRLTDSVCRKLEFGTNLI